MISRLTPSRWRVLLVLALVALSAVAAGPTQAQSPEPAATINVACGDTTALQNAITTANGGSGQDTIVLNPSNYEACGYTPTVVLEITEDLIIQGNGASIDAGDGPGDAIWVYGTGVEVRLRNLNVRSAVDDGITVFNEATLTLINVTIHASADHGLVNESAATTYALNTTFSGNASSGVLVSDGTVFASFTTSGGNGDYGLEVASTGRLDARAVALAHNTDGDCSVAGTLNDDGYNFDEDNSCSGFDTHADNVVPELFDNGGPVLTHQPMNYGPLDAVDTCTYDSNGDDSYDATLQTDARGVARGFDIDGNTTAYCDAGAVELWPETFVVNDTGGDNDDTNADGLCETAGGACTLRAAVSQANAQPDANTIVLNGGATYAPNGYALVITQDVRIRGNNALLDATNSSNLDGLRVGEGTTFIDGLRIANADDAVRVDAGGLLELNNSALYDNDYGVWLFESTAALRVVNSTLVNNRFFAVVDARNTRIANSLMWNNGADLGIEDVGTTRVINSTVQDGVPPAVSLGNNNSTDPLFVDLANDDFHLQASSPAIDTGDWGQLRADLTDRDTDGNRSERTPLDLDGNPRVEGGLPDRGAYETPTDPFADVPSELPAPFMEAWVEFFYQTGITSGKGECDDGTTPGPGELLYCPKDKVNRAEMAVFILRALEYPILPYNPPNDPTDPFADVFTGAPDLPAPFMEAYIEEFYNRDITSGKGECEDGTTPGPGEIIYCPPDKVTRADMAVFIIRALEVENLPYSPTNDPTDPFADVPSELPAPFMEAWVEEFLARGITTGKANCENSPDPGPGELTYCPKDEVTRAEMAVFILRAFDDIPDPND